MTGNTIKMPEATPSGPLDKILAAICAAMGQVKIVAKENDNKFDKYMFASIDDFLTLVNPICVANGLIFHMQEGVISEFMKKGRNGESSWLRMTFEITAYHTSGQSLPPVFRSVEVQRTGAQASGSAQSYALKQYLRSLLLIPTGDKDDADFAARDNGVASQSTPAKTGASKTESTRKIFRDLQDNIHAAEGDIDALTIWGEAQSTKDAINQLPADWQNDIRNLYKTEKSQAMNGVNHAN